MILKSFDFHCDFDLDFQITTSKMILILILNHLYLGDLILILKSSTYDDFAHLWSYIILKVFESTFRNRFRLSVCTTVFKRITGLHFYPQYLMLYINQFVSTSSTN